MQLPIIDVSPLAVGRDGEQVASKVDGKEVACKEVARQIDEACRRHGFFYITNHGVPAPLMERLEQLSREFFALPLTAKREIRMERGGRAWRGYFAVGDELTSGKPDQKEGLYFGAELDQRHPKVAAGVPLHGPNLFPAIDGFREVVLEYLQHMTELGQRLMSGVAVALGLPPEAFRRELTADPTVLFRIFHYPPLAPAEDPQLWSVGEHTDYGLLTILHQDENGGLQVKSQGEWTEAPPVPGTLVCNLGDMLDRMTGGRYQSTPHRVRNRGARGRLSFPFFFDPGWDAEVRPLLPAPSDPPARWDGLRLDKLEGPYGRYLLAKVAKVFPELSEGVAGSEHP